MNGIEFKAWREVFGLTQADIAEKFGVTRTTIQNWESSASALPPPVEAGCEVWGRRLRQVDPVRGPVTLVYTDAPMFVDPYGPRRPLAMMRQEAHISNAAVLARVQMLASRPDVHNPFVIEADAVDIWNANELQRVIVGSDTEAPTLKNLLRRLAAAIRADAANFVRSGPKMATEQEILERKRAISMIAERLERSGAQVIEAILHDRLAVEAALAKVRDLGIRPNDALVTAIAQAFVAATMPTAN
jgi:hypothetical protein